MRATHTPAPLTAAIHGLAASAPLLLLLPLLFAALGPEKDIMWTFRVHKDEHEALREIMSLVSAWANPALYVVWAGLLWRGLRRGDKALVRLVLTFAAVQFLVDFLVLNGVKIAVGRSRPSALTPFWDPLTLNPLFHSFPSGHTAEFTGSVLPLALWQGRWRLTLAAGLALALVGFSRIYLCEHYPTDVFFGWVLGAFAGSAAFAFWRRGQESGHA